MMRVVLDANVLVSGVIAPGGSPAQILDAWRQERLQPVISPAILEELARVLRYPRVARYHKWRDAQIVTFLEDLSHLAVLTPGKLNLSIIDSDPTDNRYLECAVEGDARYIVSGDRPLLDLGEYEGIRILTSRALVELLRREQV